MDWNPKSMCNETVLQVISGKLTYRTTHQPMQKPVDVQSAGYLGPPKKVKEEGWNNTMFD